MIDPPAYQTAPPQYIPSNELHVRCQSCNQIRIIKRPPGELVCLVDILLIFF